MLLRGPVELLVQDPPDVPPGDPGERVVRVGHLFREGRARPPIGEGPAGGPDGDPVQPGGQGGRGADRLGPPGRPEEDGLERVLGVGRWAEDPAADGQDDRPVPADPGGERVRVGGPGEPAEQVGVGGRVGGQGPAGAGDGGGGHGGPRGWGRSPVKRPAPARRAHQNGLLPPMRQGLTGPAPTIRPRPGRRQLGSVRTFDLRRSGRLSTRFHHPSATATRRPASRTIRVCLPDHARPVASGGRQPRRAGTGWEGHSAATAPTAGHARPAAGYTVKAATDEQSEREWQVQHLPEHRAGGSPRMRDRRAHEGALRTAAEGLGRRLISGRGTPLGPKRRARQGQR
ncbi:MAG: hypothetical protein JWO38_3307 [Gemmataceae bacterium]|nr:hypothetical protein [Gemmataceae bacterium]